jgi:hypothetical protein
MRDNDERKSDLRDMARDACSGRCPKDESVVNAGGGQTRGELQQVGMEVEEEKHDDLFIIYLTMLSVVRTVQRRLFG